MICLSTCRFFLLAGRQILFSIEKDIVHFQSKPVSCHPILALGLTNCHERFIIFLVIGNAILITRRCLFWPIGIIVESMGRRVAVGTGYSFSMHAMCLFVKSCWNSGLKYAIALETTPVRKQNRRLKVISHEIWKMSSYSPLLREHVTS